MMAKNYDEYDDLDEPSKSWKCKLCSTENTKGEELCRICNLPRFNKCSVCQKQLDASDHFCKHCGSESIFFQAAVYDAKEREYARKSSKQLISEWKKRGVSYLNAEDIDEYNQQLRAYGEILG